ncbi:MAG: TrkH family potassium uptake protein [Ruminococcaceae bacterium]|nr:TrkH family potassium uptake protein [Oscillospiraceae bacterium]
MNYSLIVYFIGRLMRIEAVLLSLPLLVSMIYKENRGVIAFASVIVISFILGWALMRIFKPKDKTIYAREGFVMVALSWLVFSSIGALPFVISNEIPHYIDAFFETVSGFTTTGASILRDVESMSYGMLFWRSFTHWIGGMGILVFVVALLPGVSDRSIHILKAEMPGPIMGKLVPKLKDTAKLLYLIYIILTVTEAVLLLCGGMPVFDSIVHTFGTAGTGGFGIKGDSIAGYSPYSQWVITIFMLVFGLNFNVYYFLLFRKFREAGKIAEAWVFLTLVVVSAFTITLNILPTQEYSGFGEALRYSAFQVATVISTTGYATTNFDAWPALSKAILIVLMFIGSCANSTAGGLKISRVIILFKSMGAEVRKLLHPRSVTSVRYEGKPLDKGTISGVKTYFAFYIMIFFIGFIAVSCDPWAQSSGFNAFETNFSAMVACFNNIGPGFGGVGPDQCYAGYGYFTKIVLSFAMLLGRLEIFPIILFFAPATWKHSKKK